MKNETLKSSLTQLFVVLIMSTLLLIGSILTTDAIAANAAEKEPIIENADGSITVSKEVLAEWLKLRALQDVKQRELDRQIKEIEKTLKYKCS
jgi:hypothetical protein